jgi:hypothetical protein
LTQARGDDARVALAVLNKAMQGQELTASQTDQLARTMSAALAGGLGGAAARGAATEATRLENQQRPYNPLRMTIDETTGR